MEWVFRGSVMFECLLLSAFANLTEFVYTGPFINLQQEHALYRPKFYVLCVIIYHYTLKWILLIFQLVIRYH